VRAQSFLGALWLLCLIAVIGGGVCASARAVAEYPFLPPNHQYVLAPERDRDLNCGPYSLYLACRRLGMRLSLRELCSLARPGGRPATLHTLEKAVETLGLQATCVRVTLKEVVCLPTPAVAYLRSNGGLGHFAAILDTSSGRVLLASPPYKPAWVAPEEVKERWDGRILLVSAEEPRLFPLRRYRLLKAVASLGALAACVMLIYAVVASRASITCTVRRFWNRRPDVPAICMIAVAAVAGIGAVLATVLTGNPPISTPAALPALVCREGAFDAGVITPGAMTHTFVLHNRGSYPVEITGSRATCQCTTGLPERRTVAPGADSEVTVTYNTLVPGAKRYVVYLSTSDPHASVIPLIFTARVEMAARIIPAEIGNWLVPCDSQGVRTLWLVRDHSGEAPLSVPAVSTREGDVQAKLVGHTQVIGNSTSTAEATMIQLQIAGALPLGSFADTVLVKTGLGAPATVEVPVRGTIVPPVAVSPHRLVVVDGIPRGVGSLLLSTVDGRQLQLVRAKCEPAVMALKVNGPDASGCYSIEAQATGPPVRRRLEACITIWATAPEREQLKVPVILLPAP